MTWTYLYLMSHVYPKRSRESITPEIDNYFETTKSKSDAFNELIILQNEKRGFPIKEGCLYKYLTQNQKSLPLMPFDSLIATPFHWSAHDWENANYEILMNWCIFNPNGPTIYSAGIIHDEFFNTDRIFFKWLHFLNEGHQYILAQSEYNSSNTEIEKEFLKYFILQNLPNENQSLVPDCIPYMIWAKDGCGSTLKRLLKANPQILNADWGQEMYYLAKYGKKMFDRAGEESRRGLERIKKEDPDQTNSEMFKMMELRLENIPSANLESLEDFDSKPFSENDFERWWQIITQKDFKHSAWSQFGAAWTGAINQYGGYSQNQNILNFTNLNKWLFDGGCNIWPEQMTDQDWLNGME